MQKETKIQGILMCLLYLGHLCLDLGGEESYYTDLSLLGNSVRCSVVLDRDTNAPSKTDTLASLGLLFLFA